MLLFNIKRKKEEKFVKEFIIKRYNSIIDYFI